jgi:carbonic anhydrase
MQTHRILLLAFVAGTHGAAWNYTDTTSWTGTCPTGVSQSPININSSNTVWTDYSSFAFSLGYDLDMVGKLHNNGHTVQFEVNATYDAFISGGPLSEKYQLAQLHFHWGSVGQRCWWIFCWIDIGTGSEHTYNEQQFLAEVHFVHYKASYANLSVAVAGGLAGDKAALAVVGIVMEAGRWGRDSPAITKLIRGAKETSGLPIGNTTDVTISLIDFVAHARQLSGMFSYDGGLTTPGCYEIVKWIVLDKPMRVSLRFIEALQSNKESNGQSIQKNFRPVQPIGSRTVKYYNPLTRP